MMPTPKRTVLNHSLGGTAACEVTTEGRCSRDAR